MSAPDGSAPRGRAAGLMDRNVASLSWWQVRHSPRFILALIVTALPILAGVLSVMASGFDARRGATFAPGLVEMLLGTVLYAGIPLVALLLAGGLVADDVEDRTLSYLLVRPLRRSTLYASKLVPVALATAALGALQAFGLGLMRLLAWLMYGMDQRVRVYATDGTFGTTAAQPTVDAGLAIFVAMLGGILAAFLLGFALACVFGFVSLSVPRFHFVANLLLYLCVELPFSFLGVFGLGLFLPTVHAINIVTLFDLTHRGAGKDAWGSAATMIAIPMVLLLSGFWVWMGLRRVRTKDFNITSATS